MLKYIKCMRPKQCCLQWKDQYFLRDNDSYFYMGYATKIDRFQLNPPPPLLSLNGAYVISMAFVDISSDQRSIVGLKVEWVEQMSITQRQAALSVHYTGPSITKTRGEKWGNQR